MFCVKAGRHGTDHLHRQSKRRRGEDDHGSQLVSGPGCLRETDLAGGLRSTSQCHVQTHQNIVAVAVLHEMAAIILTGGQAPDQETIEKAEEEGIPILIWPGSAFELAGQAYAAGVANT